MGEEAKRQGGLLKIQLYPALANGESMKVLKH